MQREKQNLKKGQSEIFKVESVAFGGAGVAKFNGMTVFIEGAMRGETVRASFNKFKPNYAFASLEEVLEPSPIRVKPKCPHFSECGGCQFQYMPYSEQLKIKGDQVIETLEHVGKIQNAKELTLEPIGSKDDYYYRNKLEFSFGYDQEMNFAFGYHAPGRKFDILNINECHLMSPEANKILQKVKDFCLNNNYYPFKISSGEGFLRSLFIREGKRTGERMINILTTPKFPPDFTEKFKDFIEEDLKNLITSAYHSTRVAERGKPTVIKEELIFGNKFLNEELRLPDGQVLKFQISPQAFFQVNTLQAELLYGKVVDFAIEDKNKKIPIIFDLFCGTGTIGMFLSKYAMDVIGVEINEEAVKSAQENVALNNISNLNFFTGDASDVVKRFNLKPNLIVVDPPRAGLSNKMLDLLIKFGAEKIIYVSCNPATLARDLSFILEQKYTLKKVQPVDMFPQTAHIETICLLEKNLA